MIETPNYSSIISKHLQLREGQVKNTLTLIEEGATTPFIARYRKEVTGNLDENQIRDILALYEYQQKLFKIKKTALESISEQNKLTEKLKESITNSTTIQEVEDLYAPYKRAKKTKADIAREKGFEPIANQIKSKNTITIDSKLLETYKKEEIIEGAQDIIAQEIADDVSLKNDLRYFYTSYGEIESSYKSKLDELPQKDQKQIHKFELYDGFSQEIKKLKSYQVLALNRGENLNILSVKINNSSVPLDNMIEKLTSTICCEKEYIKAIKQGYTKLFKSVENELKTQLTKKAHEDSIISFQKNLKELLLTKPNYNKTILAIDPGFRTGCKLAILDKHTNPQEFDKIFLDKKEYSIQKIKSLISKYSCDCIVIGNGTASNETFELLSQEIEIPFIIVNESGASVYSASKIGAQEFKNLDATDRGTISIGRRYIDPLSELIKIPVESIGVGMYQHDINQKELNEKLSYVVEDVVHSIGVQVNTASKYLLEKISGLTSKSAQKIYDNRPYTSRNQLKKLLTPKAYEYAIGFLRINNPDEELDSTAIHPKDYDIAKKIIKEQIRSFNKNLGIEESVFNFIKESYEKKDEDIRIYEANIQIKKTRNIDDLKEDEVIEGVVRNIMQFGAFVDIGVKQDGLVHISEVANTFVEDVNKFLTIGQKVKVKIISIDKQKNKIQLSIKQVND